MPLHGSVQDTRLLRRDLFWAQKADQAVPKEDLGGLHWRLPHNSGCVLVLVRLYVPLQVDDVSPHGQPLVSTQIVIFSWSHTRPVAYEASPPSSFLTLAAVHHQLAVCTTVWSRVLVF